MHWLVTWIVVWTLSIPCPQIITKEDPYGRGIIERHYTSCTEQKTKYMERHFSTKEEAEEFVQNGEYPYNPWNFGISREWKENGYEYLKYDTGNKDDNIKGARLENFKIIKVNGYDFSKEARNLR